MTAPVARTVVGNEYSFDVRWARWQEAGAAQDLLLNRRAAVVAVLAFCALVTWLGISVYTT